MSASCRVCGIRWVDAPSAKRCCQMASPWEDLKEVVLFAVLSAAMVGNLVLWSFVFQP
jgi:hypothetical protein